MQDHGYDVLVIKIYGVTMNETDVVVWYSINTVFIEILYGITIIPVVGDVVVWGQEQKQQRRRPWDMVIAEICPRSDYMHA